MPNRPIVPYHLRLRPRARNLRRDPTPADCSAKRLVIEVDGDSHFDTEAEARDASRTAALEAQGLRVIRIRNDEIRGSFEAVCERILETLET